MAAERRYLTAFNSHASRSASPIKPSEHQRITLTIPQRATAVAQHNTESANDLLQGKRRGRKNRVRGDKVGFGQTALQ